MLTLEHQLVTTFHRELATDDWLESLASHLQSVISNHPEYRTAEGTGNVAFWPDLPVRAKPGACSISQFERQVAGPTRSYRDLL